MSHCKDCRYWRDRYTDHAYCSIVNLVGKDDKINDNQANIFSNAYEDIKFEVRLKTGPLFGCRSFKLWRSS